MYLTSGDAERFDGRRVGAASKQEGLLLNRRKYMYIARKYRQNLNVAVLSLHSDVVACHVIVVVGLQRLSLVQLSNRTVVGVVLRVGDDRRLAVHSSSPNPADTCYNTCCDEHYQCADDSSDESGLALVFLCSEEDQVSAEQ